MYEKHKMQTWMVINQHYPSDSWLVTSASPLFLWVTQAQLKLSGFLLYDAPFIFLNIGTLIPKLQKRMAFKNLLL